MNDYRGVAERPKDQLEHEHSSVETKGDYRAKDHYMLAWVILLVLTIIISAYLVFLR